jgi:aryl-alcohol dehydrogenase-like predicted oxidoreductase
MKTRRIGGQARLEASVLCLGTMYFGTMIHEATSFDILDRFVERGGSFLDTANAYAYWVEGGVGGESEALLGRWMASRRTRDSVVVGSKVGARPRAYGLDLDDAEGLSGAVIRKQIQSTLERLQTDRVDVYYAHWEDRSVPLEETVGAFAGLVTAGLVRVLGVSNHATWRVERARAIARERQLPGYTCVQQLHTYLTPRPRADTWPEHLVDGELLDYSRSESDLTLLAYSPLLKGTYSHPERLPAYFDHPETPLRLRTLQQVAHRADATVNQVVLAWLLQTDPPIIPVFSVSSVSQLEECLAAADLGLDADLWERLESLPSYPPAEDDPRAGDR